MKDFDKLQDLWKQQKPSTLPDVSLIIAKAKKEKQQFANKMLFQILTLIASLVGVAWVVSAVDFKMITTFIGIALMFLCVFGFTLIRIYQMIWLKRINVTDSPSKNITVLEKFYKFQQFVGTKVALAYFLLLNLAFAFYFIEVIAPMSALAKTITLVAYSGWMLFAYFYLGKKQKAKEYARTQSIIDALKEMEENYTK
ncbi:hypothetical protein [Flavobacterium pedocola]